MRYGRPPLRFTYSLFTLHYSLRNGGAKGAAAPGGDAPAGDSLRTASHKWLPCPARPRTAYRIFVGDDVEGSYEPGEPNSVTTSTICQARIVSGDSPPPAIEPPPQTPPGDASPEVLVYIVRFKKMYIAFGAVPFNRLGNG